MIAISLLVVLGSVSCTDSPAIETDTPAIEEGYLDVNGTRLFFKSMGSGDPIVVLHGGPGFDHRQFLPYIWGLAEHHKVILFDQRGTGLSSGPVDVTSISIDTFIADIEGIREAFGIEKMNLLGHSWGGILAMYYGVRHPENLKTLVLASTAASFESFAEMTANYEADRLPEDAALLQEIYSSNEYQNGDPQAVEKFWRVYFKPYFADQSLVAEMDLEFTEKTIKHGEDVANFILQSIGEFDLHDDLQAIRCPTLVIHGAADPMPVKYAERIHDSIPGSELVIIQGAGHWIFVDGTDEFVSSIDGFLARNSARTRY
ncbi:MAG: alpha/beta fold hydrolase [Candidatus Aminicenantes bacterium]|nr:MAG: alpha/beta fold hydrolase [Candidatus Aminicenantes bacterium]